MLESYITAKLTDVNLGAGNGDLIANGNDKIITGSEACVRLTGVKEWIKMILWNQKVHAIHKLLVLKV